ncbi:hypothetical protein Pmar_PMAR009683, partial [Perkinsus marinus ATCC 50983]
MRRVTGKKRRSGGDQERLEMILDDVNAELTKAVNRMTMLWVFAKAREQQTIDEASGDMSIVALKYLTDDVDISGSLRRTTRRTRPTGFGLPWGRPVPGSALVRMPGVEKGFVKNVLSKLTFDTLFTERAVIRTVVGVRALCIDLLKSHPTVQLLPVNLPYKPCSLEAFKEWQKAAIEKTAAKVVDCFTGKVVKMIRGNLEVVGKGWFNIDETSLEVYNYSKLKKFIVVMRLMLQDCLRDLAINTAELYVRYIKRHVPREVRIENLHTVINEWKEGTVRSDGSDAPRALFTIEIKRIEKKGEESRRSSAAHATNRLLRKRSSGEVSTRAASAAGAANARRASHTPEYEFAYATNPAMYVQAVAGETLLTALRAINDVPHIEKATVPQLFKSVVYRQKLATLSLDDDLVVRAKEELEEELAG